MRFIEGDFIKYEKALVRAIRAGKTFIYPTDTIYGIGVDATNAKAVAKLRKIKNRDERPFLIAVPTLEWIWDNCEVSELQKHEIEKKLPGRYAFFLKLKNLKSLAYSEVNPLKDGTIGVRFFNHSFQKIITAAGRPFVTTSVNTTGEPFAENLDQMSPLIRKEVDYIVYQGPIAGPPSTKIDFTKEN